MSEVTRPRGHGDTRRLRYPPRAFAIASAVALFLHLPLAPFGLGSWLRMFWSGGLTDYDAADAEAIIPVDLDLTAHVPEPEAPKPPEPAPPEKPPAPVAPAVPGPVEPAAPKPAPEPKPEPKPAGPGPVSDPIKAAGSAGKIAAKDPNVQVLLSGKVLRKNEVGPTIARLLGMIPEWRPFLEGTGIDPVRDIDHILITAPYLRRDTAQMVVVMDMNLSPERIREALEVVVRQNQGAWMEDSRAPAAGVKVGGSRRVFAQIPGSRLLAVVPPEAFPQIDKLKRAPSFKNGAEAAVISLLTPARPFERIFPLPKTLKWMRVALTPTKDGGVDVAIEAGDAGSEEAEKDAQIVGEGLNLRRKVELPFVGAVELMDEVSFKAEGAVIRGRTHVPGPKLRLVLAWLEEQANARFGNRPARQP